MPALLVKDRAGMSSSLESKFTSESNIINFLFNLNGALKINKNNTKVLLKKLEKLPKIIYKRKDKWDICSFKAVDEQ